MTPKLIGQTMKDDHHNSAAELILKAAENSGLLRDVAVALRASHELSPRMPLTYSIVRDESGTHHFLQKDTFAEGALCLACGVLDRLTEKFEEECLLLGYNFFCEGHCLSDYSDEELAPYLPNPPRRGGLTDEEIRAVMEEEADDKANI